MTAEKRQVPALRFPGFEGEWTLTKFGDIICLGKEKYNPIGQTEEVRCIDLEHLESNTGILLGYSDANESKSLKTKFVSGDILYGKLRPYLKKYHKAKFNGVCTTEIWVFKAKNTNSDFLATLIQSRRFDDLAKMSSGSKMPRAEWRTISKGATYVPSIKEQGKIADFLSEIDERIELLKRRKDRLEKYKRGVMQQIFSHQLRFKDSKGKDYPLGRKSALKNFIQRTTERNDLNNTNVLTISAQLGLVNQLLYYNSSVASKDLSNYFVLHKGDFAYNKSYSTGYPFGAFKRLDYYEKGIVSPLYICFRPKSNINSDYLKHYFEAGMTSKGIQRVAQEGARNHGLLNIGIADFLNLEIYVSSLEEQQKIADFLSAIDNKIELCEKQITDTEKFKKGLLQQMFV